MRFNNSYFLVGLKKWGLPFFFLLVYLLFPTNNSTVDGWGYAEEIKYGYNLFRSHHLLYNALGFVLLKALGLVGINADVLAFMKVLNAVAAFGILLVFRWYLNLQSLSNKAINGWLFFVGSAFGLWRFAVENETYLIPIFFSLLGSVFFALFSRKRESHFLFWSAVFASLACLFHQLQIFWWIALFVGLLMHKSRRLAWSFLAVSSIVPFVYLLVYFLYEEGALGVVDLLRFVLHDFYGNGAEASIDYRNFLMTPISLFRTFFQVHGNILLFLKGFPLLWGAAIFALSLALLSLFDLRFLRMISFQHISLTVKVHILAFVLHLAFAFFSHGNAEFMVVLIVLLPLVLVGFFDFPNRILWKLGLAMFVWNASLAILPANRLDFNNDKALADFVIAHPNKVFVLSDKNVVANICYYVSGHSVAHRVFTFPLGVHKEELLCLQEKGAVVLTDVLSRTTPLSRGSMLEGDGSDGFIFEETYVQFDSFYETFSLDRVRIVE